MSTDTAIAAARSLAASWESEAERRRRISRHDPASEALAYCAEELREVMRPLDSPGAIRTVPQFAADRAVTPSCVRRWIVSGRLEATKTPHGYRIAHNARVQPLARRKTA
jgi:hypothetical protein